MLCIECWSLIWVVYSAINLARMYVCLNQWFCIDVVKVYTIPMGRIVCIQKVVFLYPWVHKVHNDIRECT
jgi:hypothetical protein